MSHRPLYLVTLSALLLSSCALVDKEAIIGTWVCEDFEFVTEDQDIPIPKYLLKRAEREGLKMVFTFHDEEECTEEHEGRRIVDTYYEIDDEEEMLYIFHSDYRGKRSRAEAYDIVTLNDETMVLRQSIAGDFKAQLSFYKED